MSAHTQDAYSLKDTAGRLGISYSKLRDLIRTNHINVKYIGSKGVVRAVEIDAFLDALPSEPPTK